MFVGVVGSVLGSPLCCGVGILFSVVSVVCIALFSDGSCLQHQKLLNAMNEYWPYPWLFQRGYMPFATSLRDLN